MKILHLMPSFQHPSVRGPTRHYHFARELAREHSITLLTLVRSPVGEAAMRDMSDQVDRLMTFEVNGHAGNNGHPPNSPIAATRGRLEKLRQVRAAVQRMTEACGDLLQRERFDVLLFHGKCLFPVLRACRELPTVIDFCDATTMRLRTKMRYSGPVRTSRLLYKYWQVRRVERGLLRTTPYVAFISPRDREAVLSPPDNRLVPQAAIEVLRCVGRRKLQTQPENCMAGWEDAVILPNGVDTEFWRRSSPPADNHCIVFTGVMDYAPNHDAALYLIDKIAPLVRRSIPDLELLIVGRDPLPELKARAETDPSVTVTGFVDDVRPYLERASLFAAPVRYASGTQNKVLEALAMQMPVVTTPIVADGLRIDERAEPPVTIADGTAGFADAVVNLLRDKQQRRRLEVRGRSFVNKYFVWSQSAKTLENMCLSAVASSKQRPNSNNGESS